MRRFLMNICVLAIAVFALTVAPARAQAPAAAPAAAPPQRAYNGDGGLMLIYVKPDKTADFEAAMARVKEALGKSTKPERQQQAATWKFYKAGIPSGPAGQIYVFVMAPSVKNVDYSLAAILTDGLPQEARTIFQSYQDSLGAQAPVSIPLDLVSDFSK